MDIQARDITFTSGGSTLMGCLALPEGDGLFPGSVVIHEACGLNENIRDITRRDRRPQGGDGN